MYQAFICRHFFHAAVTKRKSAIFEFYYLWLSLSASLSSLRRFQAAYLRVYLQLLFLTDTLHMSSSGNLWFKWKMHSIKILSCDFELALKRLKSHHQKEHGSNKQKEMVEKDSFSFFVNLWSKASFISSWSMRLKAEGKEEEEKILNGILAQKDAVNPCGTVRPRRIDSKVGGLCG